MSRTTPAMGLRLLIASAMLIGFDTVGFAQAGGITVSPPRTNYNALQMQMQRSQIQSQTYQLQQQINREQDRQNAMHPAPQPDVPVYHSTCTPTNGVPCQ